MFNQPNRGGVSKSLLETTTASANDILAGKVIIDKNGEPLVGTMPNRGTWNSSVGINGNVTIPAGYHNGSGRVTNSTATMGGQTITPRSTLQTVSCSGRYMTGNIVVNGDSNLVAANIISGKSIFGVAGNAKKYAGQHWWGLDSTSRGTFYNNNGSRSYYIVSRTGFGFTPVYTYGTGNNTGAGDWTVYDSYSYCVSASTGGLYGAMYPNQGAAHFVYNNIAMPVYEGTTSNGAIFIAGYY